MNRYKRFIDSDTHEIPSDPVSAKRETIQSMLGIAHEYANPALIKQEEGAFAQVLLLYLSALSGTDEAILSETD